MKKITEMTEKEVLGLTNEQLELMVKLEMAEQGVKILDRPTEPDYQKETPKDGVAYNINGCTYYALDEKIAKEIGAVIEKHKNSLFNYSYRSGDYNDKIIKPIDSYSLPHIGSISKEEYYTDAVTLAVRDIKKANKELKEAYEELLKEYNQAQEGKSEIAGSIYGVFRQVSQKYYDFDILRSRYNEYLDLADQNYDVALKFLKKAYSVSDEAEEYIKTGEVSERYIDPSKVVAEPTEEIVEETSDNLPIF